MKKKFAARVLSLVMAAAVAGSTLPVSVLAEDAGKAAEKTETTDTEETAEADEDIETAENTETTDTEEVEDTEETAEADEDAEAAENTESGETVETGETDEAEETAENEETDRTEEADDTDAATADQTAADITYTATADGQALSGVIKDSTYKYTDWTGAVTEVLLETLLIPAGTDTVAFSFSENALAYNYDAESNYLAGYYEDYMTGADTADVSVDANDDGAMDYILVQTPYDSSWNSTLLYVVTFEEVDFMAEADDGTALEDIDESGTYTYKSWTGATTDVVLKTVTIPEDTETVDLYFSRNVLAYSYDADSNYLAGWYDDYMAGGDFTTVDVDNDGDEKPDYILVQAPYDSSWNSTLLYVITFSYENSSSEETDEDEGADEDIQDMYIATGNAQLDSLISDPTSEDQDASATDWQVLGLSRAGVEIPQETLDAYYQSIADKLTENDGVLSTRRYTEYSRTILALTAAGYDPTDVAGYDLTEKLADYDAVSAQGLNGEIYALIALDCADYEIPAAPEGKTQTTREKLVQDLLDAQLDDNGWVLSGTTADVDVTALAIQALAPYYNTDAKVKAAVDAAVEKLSEMQNEDGTFTTSNDEVSGESSAQVITALCAIGIDPATDARFIKNGISAIDALENFYINGKGFAHTQDGGLNTIATNQCYYALVAYHRFLNGQSSLYDMKDTGTSSSDEAAEEDSEEQTTDSDTKNGDSSEETTAASASGSDSDTTTTTAASGVKTGDSNAAMVYLLLMLAAGITAGAIYRRKRA